MSILNKDNFRLGLIAILVVVALAIILIGPIGKEESFEIKDRCGPVTNFISHTIQDEAACKLQCRSQCETKDAKYSKIIFESKEAGCNICTCYCKYDLIGK